MVWWVDRNESIACTSKMYERYEIEEDRIFQTVNIMFSFTEENNDPYDILALIKSGVNIFNIDLTSIEDSEYKNIKKAIYDCKKLPQMSQSPFFTPVCLSVIMSIANPVAIDEDVDVVILKNVVDEKSVIEFKEFSMEFYIPVFIWLSKCINEDVIDLIRIANGIVLDYSDLCAKYCFDVIQLCKQYRKPVFCFKPEISDDIHEFNGGKRKLFVTAFEIVNDGFHGVVVNATEKSTKEQTAVVQNIVEAMRVAEDQYDHLAEFNKLRKQIPKPQLLPMTVALAASLAATTSAVSGIILITSSGGTARLLSCSVPPCHIIVVTTHEWVAKQMHLYRKVLPVLYKTARAGSWQDECRKRVLFGTEFAVKTGLFDGGAKLVVLAPAEEGMAYCDSFQIVAMPFKCDE